MKQGAAWLCGVMLLCVCMVHTVYAGDLWYTPRKMDGIIKDDIAKRYPYVYDAMFLQGTPIRIATNTIRTKQGEFQFNVFTLQMVGGRGNNAGNFDFVMFYYMGRNLGKEVRHCRMYCASVADTPGLKALDEHKNVFIRWTREAKFREQLSAELSGAPIHDDIVLPDPSGQEKINFAGYSINPRKENLISLMDVIAHVRLMREKDRSFTSVDVIAKEYLALSDLTLADADRNDPIIQGLEKYAYFALAQHELDTMYDQKAFPMHVGKVKDVQLLLELSGKTYEDLGETQQSVQALENRFVETYDEVIESYEQGVYDAQKARIISSQTMSDVENAQRDLVQNYVQLARGTQRHWNVVPLAEYIRAQAVSSGVRVSEQELQQMIVTGNKAQIAHEQELFGMRVYRDIIQNVKDFENRLRSLNTDPQKVISSPAFHKKLARLYFEDASSALNNLKSASYDESAIMDVQRIVIGLKQSKKTLKDLKISEKDYENLIKKAFFGHAKKVLAEAQQEMKYRSVKADIAIINECMKRSGCSYSDLGVSEDELIVMAQR